MIRYALLAGGILAKQPEEILLLLQRLAEHLGLAFQIRDDLLDDWYNENIRENSW